jgi:hypothetical protein
MAETQYPVAGGHAGNRPAGDTLPETARANIGSVASAAFRRVTHHELAAHVVRPGSRGCYRRLKMTNEDDGPRATT